jgi:hypothetical protein
MKSLIRNISLVFAAGCVGGLVNSVAVWVFGELGVTEALGVRLAPALTPAWLYPRIVWGGIWGALFLLPLLRNSVWIRGFLYGLGPTVVMLFVIFPEQLHKGNMGLQLGTLTPAFVVFYNFIWGAAAAWWLKHAK